MKEIWRDVKGFEGVYQVSNMGRLASLKRGFHVLSEVNKKGGYLSVVLTSDVNTKYTSMHRLVYEAFVGDIPSGKKNHIHHIDDNKQNNRVDNLRLVTSHTHHLIHIKENPKLMDGVKRYNQVTKTKRVLQYTMDGDFVGRYINCKDASDKTGVCVRNIHQVASRTPYNEKGYTRKQAGGFIWKYE